MRNYSYVRDLIGGCFTCFGDQGKWFSKNAQGLAAQHHDRTGHPTWVEVHMAIYYGDREAAERKPKRSMKKPSG